MKVFQIEFGYIWSDHDGKEKRERAEVLQLIGAQYDREAFDSDNYGLCNTIINEQQLVDLVTLGQQKNFKIVGQTTMASVDSGANALAMIEKVAKKIEQLSQGLNTQFNEAVNVHMPGNMMLSFNETMLMEDTCTDALQDAMNNGWRVIAACPQPDQRRPDYILGRYNPEFKITEMFGGAKRGL